MKQFRLSFLIVVLLCMLTNSLFAHDIEVKNADGVTIYYNYINDGTELSVTYRGTSSFAYHERYENKVVIPEEVFYGRTYKVTKISNRAFYWCTGLTSVTIPNSVTSIEEGAFQNCIGLTSITIPNRVTSIGESAFDGCSGLSSVTIPNSVKGIGGRAFCGCSGLTSVTIGSGVTSIGYGVFAGCSGLTFVTIPNSVTSIGDFAFSDCSGLTSITIPNSVTSIGVQVFSDCSGLTSVTIGSGVTSIERSAFDGVDLSTVISLIENPSAINGKTSLLRTFSLNTFNYAILYVPKGTIDKYKATGGWSEFYNIVEGTPTGITIITSDKETTNVPIYDLNGRRLTEPQKGINIIGGKKILNH